MRKLLALLVALTIGCGVAASITITRMPATTDDNGAGYYSPNKSADRQSCDGGASRGDACKRHAE